MTISTNVSYKCIVEITELFLQREEPFYNRCVNRYLPYYFCRTGSREPAGRRIHQRPSITEPYSFEDRRDGSGRHQAVRHIETAEGVTRMRIEDPESVSGNGIDQTRRDRR